MNKMLISLEVKATSKFDKLNKNYKACVCSSFCLKSTFEEIDFCG